MLTAEQVVVGEVSLANECSLTSLAVTILLDFVHLYTPYTAVQCARDTAHKFTQVHTCRYARHTRDNDTSPLCSHRSDKLCHSVSF